MLENEKRSNSTTLPQKLTKHWAAPSQTANITLGTQGLGKDWVSGCKRIRSCKKDGTYFKRQKKDEPTYTKYVNLTVVSESESSDTETTSFTSVYV